MKKITIKTLSLAAIVFLSLLGVFAIFATWLVFQFPGDKEIKGCIKTKLYQVDLCPKSASYVRLGNISEYLQKAVVLTEDSSFFSHKGFDFQEMEKSMKANLEKKRFARGGSTITQQLAKNLFLSKDKTLQRKVLEAFITMRIEKLLTKKEILERYLNVVQFGKDIFGVKAAAEFYFKKPPSALSIPESAFLTFLLPSPENYSKSYFKGQLTPFARKRLEQIVERMFLYDRITEDEYLSARQELGRFIGGGEKDSELNFDEIQEEDIKIEEEESQELEFED